VNFRFSSEEEAFRQEIRNFLKENPPGQFPIQDDDEGYGYGAWSNEYVKLLGQKGWLGLTWPASYGGGGRPPAYLYHLFNELAYGCAPAEALFFVEQGGGTICRYGNEELKKEIIPELIAGEATVVEGLSEMNAGSDLLSLKTKAVKEGDDYIINGDKIWTSNGHLARYDLLMARTDPDAPRHKGISAFLVDLNLPGVTRRPIADMAGGNGFSEMFFDNVRIPKRYLVGKENNGFLELLATLEWDRFWGRCMKASYLQRLLDDLVTYCIQPDSRKTLAEDKLVQNAIAELQVDVRACRVLFYRALWVMQTSELSTEASIAKTLADEVSQKFARIAMSILGLYGQLTEESELAPLKGRIQKLRLASVGHTLAGGTTEIQLTTIATRGLGLPR
jgi:alkylation response protein AidB-like acyl-CoA dehydrogenase